MDHARWERLRRTFDAAVALPAVDRARYLRDTCGDDPALLTDVRALLDEDASDDHWLDRHISRLAADVLTESDPDVSPSTLGPYVVERCLGQGGMGVVYLARRPDLGLHAAIKVLSDAWVSESRRARFRSEERVLAHLTHPSIARLYDADALPDGTPWFAMEYVEGQPLDEHCRQQQSALAERLRLFREVCDAVRYAHAQLVIHRDLKPSNILVTRDGHVKLLDFGIATELDAAERPSDHTRTGLRMMTPHYAAPELMRGERANLQTDVYALGVVLYELVAGRRPFELAGLTPGQIEARLTEQVPPPPSSVAAPGVLRGVSGFARRDLDVLCPTALHKDPARRYASVEALMRDLDHFVNGEPLEARRDSLGYRTAKFAGRHWRGLAAAAAVVALVAALIGFYTVRLASARNTAVAEAERTQRIQRFMLGLFDAGERDAAPAGDMRVLTLIDRGVKEAQGLEAEPAVQAALRATLGSLYQRLGKFDQADALIQASLDQRRALYGTDHPEFVESLLSVGALRADQARLDEAERIVRGALETARRTRPSTDPLLARATATLGKVIEERGDYKQAIPMLEEAVRLQEAARAPEAERATTMSELADAHFYAGNLDASQALNERVLAMNRRLHGTRHPNVADDLINLGAIQTSRGAYPEAEAYYRDALEIIRTWYGEDHPETGSALTILAQDLPYQGRNAEAMKLARRALAIQEKTYGPVHPRVAFALNALGSAALRQKDHAAAEFAFTRAADVYAAIYAGRHYRVGVAISNLGSVFLDRGDYPAAERRLREAIALFSETQSPTHLNTGVARIKLGRALARQGRQAEAETELLRGYQIVSTQANPSVSWLQTAREELALVYDAGGQPERAQKYRDEHARVAAESAGPPARR